MEERHLILRKLLSEMHGAFPGISECTHNKLKKKNKRKRERERKYRKKERNYKEGELAEV